jgi:hypothetical protein
MINIYADVNILLRTEDSDNKLNKEQVLPTNDQQSI